MQSFFGRNLHSLWEKKAVVTVIVESKNRERNLLDRNGRVHQ